MEDFARGMVPLDRVARLERAHRRSRLLNLALFLGLVLMLAAGQAAPPTIPDEIKARRFTLVDASGTSRGGLAIQNDGNVVFELRDQSGSSNAGIVVLADGGGATLVVAGRGNRATLAAPADGTAGLFLAGQDGDVRTRLTVSADGRPGLHFLDRNDKLRVLFQLIDDGSPTLVLLDEKQVQRAALSVLSGGAYLFLVDGNAKMRAVLGAADLPAPDGGTSQRRAESSLVLFGPDEKVAWEAP